MASVWQVVSDVFHMVFADIGRVLPWLWYGCAWLWRGLNFMLHAVGLGLVCFYGCAWFDNAWAR